MSSKLSAAEKQVLAVLREHSKGALNTNRIWSRLPADSGLRKDDVYKSLLRLAQKKFAIQVSKGNFMYLHPVSEITGIIQVTRRGDAFLIPENREEWPEDLLIPGEFLANALPGDLVAVQTLPGKRRNLGRVSRIVERSAKPVTGELDIFQGQAWLLPDKQSFPFDIRLDVPPDQKYDGYRASVRITDFREHASHPTGSLIEILGAKGTNEAEMHAIVAEFGFRVTFSEAVLKETEAIPDELKEQKKWKDRRDFRDIFTITIDPADAKDFDDALSWRMLENGHHEVGVHIADVSHYVKPHSALDQEAGLRGTSVYLADRTIPMLPEKLSNELCSLKPHEDRLAFSVIMELNDDSEVLNVWFGKTVIHSNRRFSYEEAQERIEGEKGDFARELKVLNQLAKSLNKKRMARGAMSFESDEIRFELDSQGKPLRIFLKKRVDAHKLIEEFMLLANREVATFVYRKQVPPLNYIYRSHDSPSPEKLMELMRFCQLFGYRIDISNEHRLRTTLNHLLKEVEGKPEEDVIVQTAIRSMAKAIYTGQRTDHFGLAFQYYTHFTSPIRRYPDLLAHRLLQRYLQGEPGGYSAEEIENLAKHSSMTEQKAAEAERASIKYKMAEYLKDHVGMTFQAVVSGITEWGIYAEIIENHCEGMIRIADLSGDRYQFIEKERKVRGMRSGRTFSLGDLVTVKVKNANPRLRMIDFVLAD